MRILWGAFMAALLAGAMAFAQDYQSSQGVDTAAPTDNAVAPDQSYQAAPSQEMEEAPAGQAFTSESSEVDGNREDNGRGITVQGSAIATSESEEAVSVEGVPAVNYEVSNLAGEKQRGGSLLPDNPQSGISGTLSSWDTSPTGVYKSSKDHLGSPFPMAAAPAIGTGDRNLLPRRELPPSMAGNLSSWDTAPTAVHKDYELMNGSPFPMSAAPPIRQGHSLLESVDEGADFSNPEGQPFADTASPFPTAGAQPRRNRW